MMNTRMTLVPICALLVMATACAKKDLSSTTSSSDLPEITEFRKFGSVGGYAKIAPVKIEAENFVAHKGVMTEDCREGGDNVGYISVGDWMDYTVNIPASGSHTIKMRTAGPAGTAEVRDQDGNVLTTVKLTPTVSGQIYATSTAELMLDAGQQTLRIYAVTRAWNFNWFELENNASGNIPEEPGAVTGVPETNNLILESTFEDDHDFKKWSKEICRSSALQISNEVGARKGNRSARFEFTKSDVLNYDGYVRAEIRQKSEAQNDRWYGFSNYLPNDFVNDPVPEKIAQWHDVPDFGLGENWRSPPISFGIENGRYYVNIIWASGLINTILTKDGERRIDLGPVDKGRWNDWVFHIKYSYKSDGILEIWKNKEKIATHSGANSYNDKSLPYFKIGIYKWGWDGWASFSPTSKRVLFYDEVRVGNGKSNLEEVSPR